MSITSFFEQSFGALPDIAVRNPGRVNLIGEHVDYNGGAVLPFALNKGIDLALRRIETEEVRIRSDRFEAPAVFAHGERPEGGWARYAYFSAELARELGWWDGGLEIAIMSDLDHGSGLSSSAALCVATLRALRDQARCNESDVDIARLARRVENELIGMPCGIMDQMAVAVPRPGQALFLDTRSLEFETIPLPQSHRFITIHTGVYRELSDGRYKERKEECDVAKSHFGTDDLCHLDLETVKAAEALSEAVRKRTIHCITEHKRVVSAAAAMSSADMTAFGALMNESHTSMRDDFEMSVPGVDAVVETCRTAGALGARLTGGGFGGCVVALVEPDRVEALVAEVLSQHSAAFVVDGGVSA